MLALIAQLVLTCGGDASVRLWRNSERVASGPKIKDGDTHRRVGGGIHAELAPVQIACFGDHEDSVYAAAWSPVDPWTFASVSYDGRVVCNVVPRAEKYKILL